MHFQVRVVNKALGSGRELVNSGHRAVFQQVGSHIESPSGIRTKTRRSIRMWYFVCGEVPKQAVDDPSVLLGVFLRSGHGIHTGL